MLWVGFTPTPLWFKAQVLCVFSHAIKKEVCSRWSLNHEPCVTHAEGRSDESVYFQMHEMFKIPPRAQKKVKDESFTQQMTKTWSTCTFFPILSLPLSPDLTFIHLRRGDLHVDDDGGEGSLPQLWGVVDGVRVQNHQLERPGQLENPLNLTLDFSWMKNTINTQV